MSDTAGIQSSITNRLRGDEGKDEDGHVILEMLGILIFVLASR